MGENMFWIKNTSGKKDAMLTFALIAFGVVTLNILLGSLSSLEFGSLALSFNSMQAAEMTAYLAATFGAYVTRRWTDKRYVSEKELEDSNLEMPKEEA